MRGRSFVAAAAAVVAALAGCTQDDQELPVGLQDGSPVTRTVPSSGDMTISTASGLSMTPSEGALPAGSRVAVARIELQGIAGGPVPAGGPLYPIGFEEAPAGPPARIGMR